MHYEPADERQRRVKQLISHVLGDRHGSGCWEKSNGAKSGKLWGCSSEMLQEKRRLAVKTLFPTAMSFLRDF